MATRKRPHFLGVWLSDSAKKAIEDHMDPAKPDRSDAVRRMLAFAAWKMPKGWKP